MQKKIFSEFIRKRGLKFTRQRELILNVLLDSDRHLSVEEMYRLVKRKDKTIGQATVYRTVKLLCEAGLARTVDFGSGITHYEQLHGRTHHDHLICSRCGEYVEAMDPQIEKLQEKLCKKYGFLPTNHRMEIFGICRLCRKGEKPVGKRR